MYRGIYDNSKGFAFGILFCYLGAKVGAFVGLSAFATAFVASQHAYNLLCKLFTPHPE